MEGAKCSLYVTLPDVSMRSLCAGYKVRPDSERFACRIVGDASLEQVEQWCVGRLAVLRCCSEIGSAGIVVEPPEGKIAHLRVCQSASKCNRQTLQAEIAYTFRPKSPFAIVASMRVIRVFLLLLLTMTAFSAGIEVGSASALVESSQHAAADSRDPTSKDVIKATVKRLCFHCIRGCLHGRDACEHCIRSCVPLSIAT